MVFQKYYQVFERIFKGNFNKGLEMFNFIGEKMPDYPDIYEKFVRDFLNWDYNGKFTNYIKSIDNNDK